MDRWHLGLHPSAIQDGAYQDFHRGQQATFPVAFEPQAWQRTDEREIAAVRVEECLYDLVAPVAGVFDEAWTLDCGLVVVGQERPPAGIEVGDWLSVRARLGASPHPSEPHAPTYTWFLERVFHRIPLDAGLADLGLPDLGLSELEGLYGGPEEPGWEELAFTDAWRDDDGHADYLLECLIVTDAAAGPGPI